MADKFELTTMSKDVVVSAVNTMGADIAKYNIDESKLSKFGHYLFAHLRGDGNAYNLTEKILTLHLDTHEGRKDFLTRKFGIDANTPDNYRIAIYQDETGQHIFFTGHMDNEKKLVLTGSCVVEERELQEFFFSSFKSLPKPIEVLIKKSTAAKDGSANLELTPEEQKKLETQAAFATLLNKVDGIQLTSNASLPCKQKVARNNLTI